MALVTATTGNDHVVGVVGSALAYGEDVLEGGPIAKAPRFKHPHPAVAASPILGFSKPIEQKLSAVHESPYDDNTPAGDVSEPKFTYSPGEFTLECLTGQVRMHSIDHGAQSVADFWTNFQTDLLGWCALRTIRALNK